MHGSLFIFIVPFVLAIAGIALLGIEVFKKQLTWRAFWAGALIFPLYAFYLNLNLVEMRYRSHFDSSSSTYSANQAATVSEAQQAAQAAAAQEAAAQAVYESQKAADATRPKGSEDGLVTSYGNNKVSADQPLVYNGRGDAMSAICDHSTRTLKIILMRNNLLSPSQSIALRLNNEQNYRAVTSFTKSLVGDQIKLRFDSSISCPSIEMLFVTINDTSPVELLIYRVSSAKN